MLDSLNHLVNELSPLLEQYGYLILAVAIAIEGVGIPAPGQSLLIVAVILAISNQLSMPLVLIIATISAFSGNLVGYFIGRKFGDVLLRKNWIKPKTEQRLQNLINRYGMIAIVMSRFIEGLKQYLSLGCGIAKMPLRNFILGNGIATAIWIAVFGFGPILIESQMAHLVTLYHNHQYAAYTLVLAILIVIIASLVYWKKKSQITKKTR